MALSTILLVISISACVNMTEDKRADVIESCVSLCKDALAQGRDLSNGPCLSDDNPKWNINDWVCDVAHWPRESIDNLAENQCREFRERKAHHFVEVNEKCEFIRAR